MMRRWMPWMVMVACLLLAAVIVLTEDEDRPQPRCSDGWVEIWTGGRGYCVSPEFIRPME